MESQPRILLIGDDDDLRLSRDLILQKNGYEVESVTSKHAMNTPPDGRFQVAVISQSVSSERALRLAASLRERLPECRILRIQEARPHLENVFDLSCDILSGPLVFLGAVRSLCDGHLARTRG